jgi:ubiquitin C-terminal hydrolase
MPVYHMQTRELPLDKCLQKFTEEEPLDDTICPKCHEDGVLRKKFALWRLPAVLIIQLKRFQFNSYSRRKLNNQVTSLQRSLPMPLSSYECMYV